MTNTEQFKSTAQTTQPLAEQTLKKKKLWRSLFLLNLCISILLVGLYWVPIKMIQLESFADSPSVNLPKEGVVPISNSGQAQTLKGSKP